MRLILFVGAGSFVGGICRYLLSVFIQSKNSTIFPFGTLLVNLIGCFVIGCLYGISEKWPLSEETRLLFVTGVLGGFTTFSSFSVESFNLLKDGHAAWAVTYILTSVLAGLALTAAGFWIFKFTLR